MEVDVMGCECEVLQLLKWCWSIHEIVVKVINVIVIWVNGNNCKKDWWIYKVIIVEVGWNIKMECKLW
jgi:hypothetical protein